MKELTCRSFYFSKTKISLVVLSRVFYLCTCEFRNSLVGHFSLFDPSVSISFERCAIQKFLGNKYECYSPKEKTLLQRRKLTDLFKTMANRLRLTFYWDPLDHFCEEKLCSLSGENGLPRYFDPIHIGEEASSALAPAFSKVVSFIESNTDQKGGNPNDGESSRVIVLGTNSLRSGG